MIDTPPNRLYKPFKNLLLFIFGVPVIFGAIVGAWEAITYIYFYISAGLNYDPAAAAFADYWLQAGENLGTARQYFFAMLLGFILGVGAFFVVLFLQYKV
jgi:hypothetical protein